MTYLKFTSGSTREALRTITPDLWSTQVLSIRESIQCSLKLDRQHLPVLLVIQPKDHLNLHFSVLESFFFCQSNKSPLCCATSGFCKAWAQPTVQQSKSTGGKGEKKPSRLTLLLAQRPLTSDRCTCAQTSRIRYIPEVSCHFLISDACRGPNSPHGP